MFNKFVVFGKKNPIRISAKAILSFFVTVMLCSLLIVISIRNKHNIEKVSMEQLITEKSIKVHEVISKLLYKTQALSALVIQGNGEIQNFERVAATIMDDPAILNLLVAPGGTVSDVFPLEGNTDVLGYNLFGEGAGNREAIQARDMGQLVFGGPFELVQGGQALVGRLPVYIDNSSGENEFWGLVSVTLKYPQALDGAELGLLRTQGFAYEIWRISPDNNQKQIIARSDYVYNANAPYIEKHIPILNADWYFRISPVREWYEYPENWMLIIAGLCISFLTGFIVQNNHELKNIKVDLEHMVETDSLTRLLNREGLFKEMERLIQNEKPFHVYYMDLDYFKQINDMYGHSIGDYVLKEFSKRIEKHTGPDHIFSRIGGDEFVLINSMTPYSSMEDDLFWEEIQNEFSTPIFSGNKHKLHLSFCKGLSIFPTDGKTIDLLISRADKNMYREKHANHPRFKL